MREVIAKALADYSVKISEVIYEQYLLAIADHGCFTLALSGGNTPKLILEELSESFTTKIDWSRVHFFWTDERGVAPSHVDSNYRLAYDCLLKNIKPGSVNRIDGEGDPEVSARNYQKVLVDHFQLKAGELPAIDFILLGMGEDGHIASIFPDDLYPPQHTLAFSTRLPLNGYQRVSLSLEVINASTNTALMVSSRYKKQILVDMNGLPVHHVKPNTLMFCDV